MNRTDIYKKYIVKRADGKEEPEAVYFVLRIDRKHHWWDKLCRYSLFQLSHALILDEDPNKSEFGSNIENEIIRFAKRNPPMSGQ